VGPCPARRLHFQEVLIHPYFLVLRKSLLVFAAILALAVAAAAQNHGVVVTVGGPSAPTCTGCAVSYNFFEGPTSGGEGTTPINATPIAPIVETPTAAAWSNGLETLTFAANTIPLAAILTTAGFTPATLNATTFLATASTATSLSFPLAANPGSVTAFGTVTWIGDNDVGATLDADLGSQRCYTAQAVEVVSTTLTLTSASSSETCFSFPQLVAAPGAVQGALH
jgi:hypothetical protein